MSPMTPPDDERAFLESYDEAAFERPSVAVDVVLVTTHAGQLQALLTRRKEHPFQGRWALPGGFVGVAESLDQAVARVLREKAHLDDVFTEQLYTFGAVDRDPRTRVISIAYYALVDHEQLTLALDGDPDLLLAPLEVPWSGLEGEPVHALGTDGTRVDLAFDHATILGVVVQRLRGKIDYAPIGFELLPDRFTLRQLQGVYESVLGHTLNKDSFRRRMVASRFIEPTGEREQGVLHRPAELYRFFNPSQA